MFQMYVSKIIDSQYVMAEMESLDHSLIFKFAYNLKTDILYSKNNSFYRN